MRNTVIYTALLLLLLQVAACKPGSGLAADEEAKVKALENLPRADYNRGGVAFSLAEIEGIRRVEKDSVPWASYVQETDDNGQLGYYFFPGYDRDLSAPQVRLEYMARSLKGCSTVDSLFTWLKGLFVNDQRHGVVKSEAPVGTLDGQEIKILEIETPKFTMNDTVTYAEKFMAWAYAEHGDRFVGFNYTAVNKDDYNQGLPLFKDLVRSYRDSKE
ncbi:MAG: hypothetical protein U0176_18000 [Bacteroidia bacterium]